MRNLNEKTVLITGGAAGIGKATAIEFAKAGANLIITDVSAENLDRAADEMRRQGYTVHAYRNDVTDREAVFELAQKINARFGGLDVLINNAGVGHHGEIADTSLEKWDLLIDVNLKGPLHFIYAFLPSMIEKRSGHIVNVSSGQAFFLLPTWGAYASIKLALGGLTDVMHYELAKHNIDVTVVYPFMVNTGFYNDVESETFGSKMSMKLLPYYSNSPETVGKIIFKAVKKGKTEEMVNVLNDIGYYSRLVKPVHAGMSMISNLFLAKRNG